MNVNEVLANIANGRVGEPLGSKQPVHLTTMLTARNPRTILSHRCTLLYYADS